MSRPSAKPNTNTSSSISLVFCLICRGSIADIVSQAFKVPGHGHIHYACVPRPGPPEVPPAFSLATMPVLRSSQYASVARQRPASAAVRAPACTGTREDTHARPNVWG
jgi:hypothetical protein